jgi:hypothetical protein
MMSRNNEPSNTASATIIATMARKASVSKLLIVHMTSPPLGDAVALARRVHMLALQPCDEAANDAGTDLVIARQLHGDIAQKPSRSRGGIGRAASMIAASSESESEIGIVRNPKFLRLFKTASF